MKRNRMNSIAAIMAVPVFIVVVVVLAASLLRSEFNAAMESGQLEEAKVPNTESQDLSAQVVDSSSETPSQAGVSGDVRRSGVDSGAAGLRGPHERRFGVRGGLSRRGDVEPEKNESVQAASVGEKPGSGSPRVDDVPEVGAPNNGPRRVSGEGGRIVGRVTHADGTPLAGVAVQLRGTSRSVKTNGEGKYELPKEIEAPVCVELPEARMSILLSEDQGTADFRVLEQCIRVTVEGLDRQTMERVPTGPGVMRLCYWVEGTEPVYEGRDFSSFESPMLFFVKANAWVSSEAHATGFEYVQWSARSASVPAVQDVRVLMRSSVDPSCSLTLRCVDSDGNALSRVIVSLTGPITDVPLMGWNRLSVDLDSSGNGRVDPVPAGMFHVICSAGELGEAESADFLIPQGMVVRLHESATVSVELVFETGGRVRIRPPATFDDGCDQALQLRNEEGKVIARSGLVCDSENGIEKGIVTLKRVASGVYSCNVPEGYYAIEVHRPHEGHQARVAVVGAIRVKEEDVAFVDLREE